MIPQIHSAIVRELDTKQKRYPSTQTMARTKLHPFYIIERPGH